LWLTASGRRHAGLLHRGNHCVRPGTRGRDLYSASCRSAATPRKTLIPWAACPICTTRGVRARTPVPLHGENDDEKDIALRQNRDQALTCLAMGRKNVPQQWDRA